MNDTTLPRRDLAEVLLALGACNEDEDDAVPWARPYGVDWERALAECRECDWLFGLAEKLLSRSDVALGARMACAAARSVLHLVPPGEDRPRLAIEAAERWTRGEATGQEVSIAVREATAAVLSYRDFAGIFYAARSARDCVLVAEAQDDDARIAFASDAIAAAAEAAEFVSTRGVRRLAKRELGPVLLAGLGAYAATLPAKETAK